ncbi:MAG: AbrB/MazE/SpoVT family DNA-binding domain-containing protein [Deferribacteraceae bacterium]|jgi:bifunctional DNA-binding transcriptional regulator/antitoxin component of YhaV-PrlF toxin-antitoxin module|nr:AbrB/MazE/SpoVT family DNA-binding domain-containing protein [Deferribacteraceae bacterium]
MITKKPIIERKIISITGKRQITIPAKFYEKLHLDKELECYLSDDAIVLRPLSVKDNDDFTMEILRDLISQGYSGEELLTKFTEQRMGIKKAIGIMINEADEIAQGRQKSATTREIFGED